MQWRQGALKRRPYSTRDCTHILVRAMSFFLRMRWRVLTSSGRQLAEFGDFLVQMRKGGFEGFAVMRVGGVRKIVVDSGFGELQILDGLFAQLLRGGHFGVARREFPGLGGLDDLGFYVLTFPTSRHIAIFSQIALSASDLSKKVARKVNLAFTLAE